MKRKIANIVMSIFCILIMIVIVLFVYKTTVFFDVVVVGESMEETLFQGDIGLVKKDKYIKEYHTGDIVIVSHDEIDVIKRIIGTPNDHVVINAKNEIYINDVILNENDYLSNDNKNHTFLLSSSYLDVYLNENQYFILGDNRDNSADSRYYGPIEKNQIKGELKLIYAHGECTGECDDLGKKKFIPWQFY